MQPYFTKRCMLRSYLAFFVKLGYANELIGCEIVRRSTFEHPRHPRVLWSPRPPKVKLRAATVARHEWTLGEGKVKCVCIEQGTRKNRKWLQRGRRSSRTLKKRVTESILFFQILNSSRPGRQKLLQKPFIPHKVVPLKRIILVRYNEYAR